MRRTILLLFLSLGFTSLATPSDSRTSQPTWKQVLNERLPLYGHRNWIVIADSAYPDQARAGIETIAAGADQLSVLEYVLGVLSSAKHVQPVVFTDRELKYVPDAEAPGVEAYRTRLNDLFHGGGRQTLPHEQIISKLDSAAQTFRVLIIKTNMTIPYTSVFLQLDCAYWSPQAEGKLRASMPKQ